MLETSYYVMREIAASWGLLFMFTFFLGACLFVFRKGSNAIHNDSAGIPFKYENGPAEDLEPEDRV